MKLNKIFSKSKRSKRAVSELIATVLLIAITLVLGSIVFIWTKSLTPEAIIKDGKNIELVCQDVSFRASYISSTKTILISNDGNVALDDIKIKIVRISSFYQIGITEVQNTPVTFILNPGESKQIVNDKNLFANAQKLVFIPVLKGKTQSGKTEEYTCSEEYGKEVVIG